jgi:hypothetical protein
VLEVWIRPDGGKVRLVAVLRPGDTPGTMTDQRPEGTSYLLYACDPKDRGGILALSHDRQSWRREGSTLYMRGTAAVERWMGEGETYERPLVRATGPATLVLRHVPGNDGRGRGMPGDEG